MLQNVVYTEVNSKTMSNRELEEERKSPKNDQLNNVHDFEPVLEKKRWVMLLIFASASMLNAFQWLHINIVAESAIFFWNGSLPSKRNLYLRKLKHPKCYYIFF